MRTSQASLRIAEKSAQTAQDSLNHSRQLANEARLEKQEARDRERKEAEERLETQLAEHQFYLYETIDDLHNEPRDHRWHREAFNTNRRFVQAFDVEVVPRTQRVFRTYMELQEAVSDLGDQTPGPAEEVQWRQCTASLLTIARAVMMLSLAISDARHPEWQLSDDGPESEVETSTSEPGQ